MGLINTKYYFTRQSGAPRGGDWARQNNARSRRKPHPLALPLPIVIPTLLPGFVFLNPHYPFLISSSSLSFYHPKPTKKPLPNLTSSTA